MKKKIFITFSILFCAPFLWAQKIEIKPYLQDAEPTSIKIMWQTDFGEESIVYWGTQKNKLKNKVSGTSFDINFTEIRKFKTEKYFDDRFLFNFFKTKEENKVKMKKETRHVCQVHKGGFSKNKLTNGKTDMEFNQ